MAALAQDKKTSDQVDTPDNVIPRITEIGVADNKKIYGGSMVGRNASGFAVPASADNTLQIVGRCEALADNTITGHADGLINVKVRRGAFYMDIAATTVADIGKLCYVIDDHTVSTDDGAGLRPLAGLIVEVRGTVEVGVLLGQGSAYANNPEVATGSGAYRARGVITVALAAYTRTAGSLPANANGAIGAVGDGITIANNDVFLLPEGIAAAAADAGPWKITSIGGAGKFTMVRPDWYPDGGLIVQGGVISVGPEGAVFGGSEWKSFVTTLIKVIDTDAPLFWPRNFRKVITLSSGTYTVGFGGGGEFLALRSATLSSVNVSYATPGGTMTATVGLAVPTANRTAGAIGTAAVIVNAIKSDKTTDASATPTVDFVVTNY